MRRCRVTVMAKTCTDRLWKLAFPARGVTSRSAHARPALAACHRSPDFWTENETKGRPDCDV